MTNPLFTPVLSLSHPKKFFTRACWKVIGIFFALFLLAGGDLRAADTWLGVTSTGGTFLWNTAGNWSGGAPAGGVVEFGTAGAGAPNSFDNISGLSLTGFLFDSGAPAYTISGTTIILTGSVINNGASVQTINDNITFSEATNNIFTNGVGNVTFGGLVTATPSGGQGAGWAFDAALTTFNGGFTSNTTGGRTLVWSGTGNILLASTFGMTAATTNALGLIFQGSGTLDLTSGTANGSISGTLAASGVTIQIASGAAPISGTSGNSTLQITGNYTIGSAGAATLTIKGGNGTTTTQGALNLQDASINTLFISSTTAGATVLTMGQSAAAATILDMDVGNNSSDSIVLGSGLKASIGTGGVIVNLNGIGGLTTSGTYTLINAQATTLAASEFTLNTTTGNLGGFTSFGLVVSGSLLQVTVGGANPTPLNAYWGGSQGSGGNGTWITFTGGAANNSNWLSSQSGGTDTHQSPGSITNVWLMADSGSNLNTNIGASTTIESLNFTGTDATVTTGSAITVSGTNLTLTINAAGVSGNTAGNGLTTGLGAGADTINTNVGLGGNQTWTLNASPSSPLTVTGTISGAHALTVAGSGELILGGNDTFTNGLTINGSAIVVLNNVGALNAITPDSVSFGAGSTGTLDLNGKNVTIGTLSTNATPGSPVIQNANGSTSGTLTVSQSGSSTYAGLLADGAGSAPLGFTLASGTLTLRGANTYTGATNINGGLLNIYGSLGAGSLVNVNGGILSGTGGTVNGAVTVNSGAELMPGTASAPGTLTLTNGLTVKSGGIVAFNILSGSSDFLNITGGSLTFNFGAILEVTGGLSASGTYTLITGTSAPSLTGVTLEDLNGNPLGPNDPHYTISVSGDSIVLGITPASSAIPNIALTTPANGTRVMANTLNITISGSVGNTGVQPLNATLTDGGGSLAVGSFTPSGGVFTTGTGAVTIFGGTIGSSGAVLGLQNYKVTVSDTAASPTSATATGTLDVLGNRQVSATGAAIGSVHVGSTGSASTTLSSTAPDNQFTRVTVADGGVDSGTNGLTITGGNPSGTFNGSFTDIRTVAGAFGSIGLQSGTVTLTTTGEGLAGETPINVGVGYTAQVFSGKASWASATGGSWITNGNWGDTQAADLNGAGAPGLAGAASIGDMATFNDVAGQAGVSTVTLTGTTVTLAGITFNSTNGYTISGGTITLQGAATPIAVSTGLDTISSVLSGSGVGLNKTGSGTLVLGVANNYTGSTTIGNGVVKANVANALPVGTFLTFGDNSNDSGQLILVGNESVGGIASIGTGTSSIVGGTTTVSTLTLNTGTVASVISTFSGSLGGAGTNQNSLALTITGSGMEVLTGSVSYTGATTISGGVLQTPNMLPASTPITLNGGVWQPVLTGSTNYNFTLGSSTAGNVTSWTAGGFAAFNGTLVLTANGGAQLSWGSGGFAAIGGGPITFGSPTSNGQVIFTNSINLAATDSFQQAIIVNGTTPGSSVLLTGQLTQPSAAGNPTEADGLKKTGLGTLILSNTTSNFAGVIFVEQGSLVAAGNSVGSGGGVFGSGTGSPNGTSTTPAAAFNINLGDGATIANSNPSLYISGAFQVDRNITANNQSTNNTYSIGGLQNASGTYSGVITVQTLAASGNFFDVSQVATTGGNALSITGGIVSNGGAGESVNFTNAGAVNVSGTIAGAGFSVIQSGSGTTTFSGNNTYTGSTVISNGDLVVTNQVGSTGSGTVSINPTANASATLSGTGLILGAVTTSNNGGLNIPHIAPGVNTNGNFGGIGTLKLNSGLTLAFGTDLDFDLGSSSDLIAVTGQLTLNNNIVVNINQAAGFTTGTYTLISYSGSLTGATTGWSVTGAPAATAATFSASGGVVTLTLTPNAAPGNAYWSGAYGAGGNGTWNTFANGSSFNTNWLTALNSGTDPDQLPSGTSNVFFIADTGSNTNTFLGTNFAINSINFTGTDGAVTTGSAVTISGSISGSGTNNTLTLNATSANGNTAGVGLTTGVGAGADTINAPIVLGASQTWILNAAPTSPLTINGGISGAQSLTVTGSGQLVLGGSDSFTGGFTINGSVNVVLNNASALSSQNAVSFGAGSSGTLNLNGNSETIGGLSSNGTGPVIRDGNALSATLTDNQVSSGTYSGVIRDGTGGGTLGFTMAGPATLTLTGSESYTGATIINGGDLQVNGSLGAGSLVTVNSNGVLGGTGTIGGGVTINSGGKITPSVGIGGAPSTLTLTSGAGLTIASGGIAAFNIINGGANDEIVLTNGDLTLQNGAILQVPAFLTSSGTYILATYVGADPSLTNVLEENLTGGAIPGNYTFVAAGGTLELQVAQSPLAVAQITINSPANGTRVMLNTGLAISGSVLNPGSSNVLTGTLADGGLAITTSTFNPPVASVNAGGALAYSGSIVSTGTNLGNQQFGVKVTDGNSVNTTATATGTVDVLANRIVVVTGAPTLGVVHQGTIFSGTITLSSTGADNQNTRVTVADSGTDAVGLSVTGGNTSGTFNGSFTDQRLLSGTLATGSETGITLVTTGEGLAGETPQNVFVGVTAQVFSGHASWSLAGNGSWSINSDWGDTAASDLGGAGAPGLSGSLSVNDTALLTDVAGQSGTTNISLNGVIPTLAGITFSSSNTIYNITTGTNPGGSLNMLNGASINVTTGTGQISATISGTSPLGFNVAPGSDLIVSSTNIAHSGSMNFNSGTTTFTFPGLLANGNTDVYNIAAGATLEMNASTPQNLLVTANSVTFSGSGTLLKSGTGTLELHSNGGNINMNLSQGAVIEIAGGLFENGGPTTSGTGIGNPSSGNGSIVWTNNKASLKVDSGASVDLWNGNNVVVDALLGTGTVTRLGFGTGSTIITVGTANGSGTFAGTLSNGLGGLNLSKVGTGLEVLTGSNTFGGYAAISGGTLRITNSAGLGFGGYSFVTFAGQHTSTASTGGALDIYGGITVNETLTLNNGSLLNGAAGTTSIFDSGIAGINFTTDNPIGASGTAPITVTISGGSGTGATATGATAAGNTAPLGGGNAANLYTRMATAGTGYLPGSAPTVTISQTGTTTIGGTATAVVSQITLQGTANTIGGAGNIQINAQISGGSGFGVVSTGTVILTNNELYTGNTAIASGATLQLGTGTVGQDASISSSPVIADSGLLAFDSAGVSTYSGSIIGTGSVSVAGTGTEVLAGISTYSGPTSIAAGSTLQFGTGTTDGVIGAGAVTNNGSLLFLTGSIENLAGAISGTGGITMSGTGSQELSGSNSYTGATVVNSGTLQLGNQHAAGNTSGIAVNGAASLNISNGSAPQTITLASGQTLTMANGASLVVGVSNSGADELVIGSGASMSIAGSGTVYIDPTLLSGTGGTFTILTDGTGLPSGTFEIGSLPALSSGSLSFTGTSVILNFTGVSTVYWTGTGSSFTQNWSDFTNFTSDATGTVPLTGTFGATQDIVFSGSGAVNQQSSLIDYNATGHSLTIDDPTPMGVDISSFFGDALTLTGVSGKTGITVTSAAGATQEEIDAAIVFAGTPNITVNNTGGLLITGVISGANGIIVNGADMLTLTGANDYTGGTHLLSGTLNVGADSALGASGAGNGVTFNSGTGTATFTGASGLVTAGDRPFIFASGTGIIDPGTAGNSINIAGVVSGTGAMEVVDTGDLVLSGSVAYNGSANVASGTLTLTFPGTVGQTGSPVFSTSPGATLLLSNQAPQNISPAANDYVEFAGSGTLLVTGGATLQMHGGQAAGNIYFAMSGGMIEVASGTLQNGGPGTPAATEGNPTNGIGSPLWSGTINGTPFTNMSSLQIDGGAVFDTWNGSGAVFDALTGSGTLTRLGFFATEGGSVVTLGIKNGSGEFDGVITNLYGTNDIIKTGTGMEIFTGSNSYSGSTMINGGVLRITKGDGLGFGGADYLTNANVTPNAGVTITGTSALDMYGGITVNKAIILSSGSLINGDLNTTSVLDNGIAAVVLGGTQSGSYASPTLSATSAGNGSGASFGAGNAPAPGGTVIFGDVTNAGTGYTVAPGLSYTDSSGTGTGVTATAVLSSLTLQGNSSVNFIGGPGNMTINAVISGTGGFTTTGAGTVTLTGSNTYSGVTTVAQGVLSVTGYNMGAGAVNVTPNAGAATLAGTGTIAGTVTTAAVSGSNVAHIAPGVNTSGNFGGIGTLTLKNGLTIGNGSDLDFDLGSSSDLIADTGSLTLGSGVVLNISQASGFAPGTYTLITYTGALAGNTNTWTAIGAPGGVTFTSGSGVVTVTITSGPNDSQLTLTPSPISIGSVLIGSASTGVTGTLSETSGNGSSASFTTVTTGSVAASPLTGAVGANSSTPITVGSGTISGPSGNGISIGTVAVTNNSNAGGSVSAVNVTANVFQTFSGSTSLTNNGASSTLFLTNLANTDGAGGQRAGGTVNAFSTGNENFAVSVDHSGTTGNATGGNNSATVDVGTVAVAANRLNGTYNYAGTVTGSTTYTDPVLATQGSIPNQTWTGVSASATVSGNTSNARANVYSAQILSGSSYAGYSLSSSVMVSGSQTHPNTGPGGSETTTATLLAGTASATTTVQMSFDRTTVSGPDDLPFRSSDILTLTGIASVGSYVQNGLTITQTDQFVLQMSYDVSQTGLEFIGQNGGSGWGSAVSFNSDHSLGTLYANESYATYVAGTTGGDTPALDAYGYSNGVAWAVLDHTSIADPISEFAVVPEPGTYAMIFSGLVMLAGFRRLRRRSRA